jgi:hypothetical protein
MFKHKRRVLVVVAAALVLALCVAIFVKVTTKAPPAPAAAAQPLSHAALEKTQAKLTQLLNDQDPKAGIAYLRDAIKVDPSLARDCHPVLHHLGHAAYEKYKDFNTTVGYQDGFCNSGYIHGAIEAHFMASPDAQAAMSETCPRQAEPLTFQAWQCYHGTGHGAMYATGKDVADSLALCEKLPVAAAVKSCANGVFMEYFIVVSHTGAPAKNAQAINTASCAAQPETYQPDCYVYAPTAYLQRHVNDYRGAFDDCKTAGETFIKTCVYGVGGQASKENFTRPEIARDICQDAPRTLLGECVNGAIAQLIVQYASTEPVKPLCDSTFARYKTSCTTQIKQWQDAYAE